MTVFLIEYNPQDTKDIIISIDGNPLEENSELLALCRGKLMQEWLEQIPEYLYRAAERDSSIEVRFIGSKTDLECFRKVCDAYKQKNGLKKFDVIPTIRQTGPPHDSTEKDLQIAEQNGIDLSVKLSAIHDHLKCLESALNIISQFQNDVEMNVEEIINDLVKEKERFKNIIDSQKSKYGNKGYDEHEIDELLKNLTEWFQAVKRDFDSSMDDFHQNSKVVLMGPIEKILEVLSGLPDSERPDINLDYNLGSSIKLKMVSIIKKGEIKRELVVSGSFDPKNVWYPNAQIELFFGQCEQAINAALQKAVNWIRVFGKSLVALLDSALPSIEQTKTHTDKQLNLLEQELEVIQQRIESLQQKLMQ